MLILRNTVLNFIYDFVLSLETMEVKWFVKIFNIKMGVLLALHLTFDGVQNAHIMELHFLLWALRYSRKLKHFSVRFQTVSMVVPSVDVQWEPKASTLWPSVEYRIMPGLKRCTFWQFKTYC